MPFTALHDGTEKTPHQVPAKEDVDCPTCGRRMRVWRRSSDGTPRHFKHIGDMGHGEGGGNSSCESVSESNEHKVWKSFAADALLNSFGDLVDEWVGYDDVQKRELDKERGLDAPKSAKNWRVGDVVLNFSERDEQLGEGIIVEVQHRN